MTVVASVVSVRWHALTIVDVGLVGGTLLGISLGSSMRRAFSDGPGVASSGVVPWRRIAAATPPHRDHGHVAARTPRGAQPVTLAPPLGRLALLPCDGGLAARHSLPAHPPGGRRHHSSHARPPHTDPSDSGTSVDHRWTAGYGTDDQAFVHLAGPRRRSFSPGEAAPPLAEAAGLVSSSSRRKGWTAGAQPVCSVGGLVVNRGIRSSGRR